MTPHKSNLTGTALMAAALAATFSISIRAQQTEAQDPLTFEVASVKATPPGTTGGVIRQQPGNQTYHAENVPLRLIMTVAYQVTDRQISGGPSWMSADRFNIEAKAARPRTPEELHVMLAHLIEERFHLKLRREARQETVWALVVDKGGSKMAVHYMPRPCGPQRYDELFCVLFIAWPGPRRDRQDRTARPLRCESAIHAGWRAPGGPDGAGPAISPDCADLFSALPKQLGLRLESAKGPVEYLVVEHAEKPTEN
jgi:hypothetical protein